MFNIKTYQNRHLTNNYTMQFNECPDMLLKQSSTNEYILSFCLFFAMMHT